MFSIVVLESDDNLNNLNQHQVQMADFVVKSEGRGVWFVIKSRHGNKGFVSDEFLIKEIRSQLAQRNDFRLDEYES